MSKKEPFKVEEENGKKHVGRMEFRGMSGVPACSGREIDGKGPKTNVKCERISDDFLSAEEYASRGDRKNKFHKMRD